jgi:7-cyano-7-deazaguanine synthase
MNSVLLLSGGMDSIALAYSSRPRFAITIDYGQRSAAGELRAAAAVATELNLEHYVLRVDAHVLGSGDLAGTPALSIAPMPEWWPFRNQFLITLAAMKAVAIGADRLLVGVVKSDIGHADGRPEFIEAMNRTLQVQEGAVTLEAPAMTLTTTQLVLESGVPLELLGWAHSCHAAEYACGVCRGCQKHYLTYKELGAAPF